MRYDLYHIINGVLSNIPLCCIRFWCQGYTGVNTPHPDPKADKAQYVRCGKCIERGKVNKIREGGPYCRWLLPCE